jgi:hypothetical protein
LPSTPASTVKYTGPLILIKRVSEPVLYEGMTGPSGPLKSTKRQKGALGQTGAIKKEEVMAELAAVLRGLAIVGEEKLMKRERSGSQKPAPTPIPNPISKPNTTKQVLWNFTLSKVRGIAEQRPVSIASGVMQTIGSVNPKNVLSGMNTLAAGLARSGLNNTNAAAYIQSSVDIGTLFLRGAFKRSQTMDNIRIIAGN